MVVFLLLCMCLCVLLSLPHGAMGWSVISDRDISWSYSCFDSHDGNLYYSKTYVKRPLSKKMKKVNKQCLLDTPRTVRVSEKTWQVIVRTRRP